MGKEKEARRECVKPCHVLLQRLEQVDWSPHSGPVRTESGSFLVGDMEEEKKRRRMSEAVRKRRKKSGLERSKKNRQVARPKKDIVDYYAAAIESLRKKALLLQEEERKKAEEKEMEDQAKVKIEPSDHQDESQEAQTQSEDIQGESQGSQKEPLDTGIESQDIQTDSQTIQTEGVVAGVAIDDTGDEAVDPHSKSASEDCSSASAQPESSGLQAGQPTTGQEQQSRENLSGNENACVDDRIGLSGDALISETGGDMFSNDCFENAETESKKIIQSSVSIEDRNDEGDRIRAPVSCFQDQEELQEMSEDGLMDSFEGDDIMDGVDDDIPVAGQGDKGKTGLEGGSGTCRLMEPSDREEENKLTAEPLSKKLSGEESGRSMIELDAEVKEAEVAERENGDQGESSEEKRGGDSGLSENEFDDEARRLTIIEDSCAEEPAEYQNQDHIGGVGGSDTGGEVEHEAKEETGVGSVPADIVRCGTDKPPDPAIGLQDGVGKQMAFLTGDCQSSKEASIESQASSDQNSAARVIVSPDDVTEDARQQQSTHNANDNVPSDSNKEPLEESGSIFNNKDIVLGFEDELGADTVLSRLGPRDDDEDVFLMDDDDESGNIGLIPDEEVEKLLGLDLKESEDESGLEHREGKVNDGAPGMDSSKLCWKEVPLTLTGGEKGTQQQGQPDTEGMTGLGMRLENNEENSSTEHSHGGEVSEEEESEVQSSTSETTASMNKSQDKADDFCSRSPERPAETADGKTSAADISPSWKRILGMQALREIQESVTSAIASAQAKQGTDSGKTSVVQKRPVLQNDKLKLKLCTGALSKALKLSAEMRKNFQDSPTESKGKSVLEGKGRIEESNSTCSTSSSDENTDCAPRSGVDKGAFETGQRYDMGNDLDHQLNSTKLENRDSDSRDNSEQMGTTDLRSPDDEIESSCINRNNPVQTHRIRSGGRVQRSDRMELEGDGKGREEAMVQSAKLLKSTPCPNGKGNNTIDVKAKATPERNNTNEDSLNTSLTAVPANRLNPLGNRTIDLTKLKMKLTPILAAEKTKSLIKDNLLLSKSESSRDSAPSHLNANKTDNQNLLKAASLTNGLPGQPEDARKSETVMSSSCQPSAGTGTKTGLKRKFIPPTVNKEKLSSILKNLIKPASSSTGSSHKLSSCSQSLQSKAPSAPTKADRKSPEQVNGTKSKISLRKRTRSTQQMKESKPTDNNKRARISLTGQKGVIDVDVSEASGAGDKGERSCFDCLSGIDKEMWEATD